MRLVEEEDEDVSVAGEDGDDAEATTAPSSPMKERDLYDPCLQTLRGQWAREQGLESLHLETTASQGSRNTGGIWTRPDIAGVSLRVFRHWPGRLFDLWTFEIKPVSAFNVIGIFEAAAHARYSTHSWALYHVTDDTETEDTTRMAAEAQRLGIGLVFFTKPDDFETWDIRAESRRQTPDPALHEEFVSVQLSEHAKDRISKWSKA